MVCPLAPALTRAADTDDTESVVSQGLGGKGPQADSTTLERSLEVFREKPAQPTAQETDERQSKIFIWKLAINASELLPWSSCMFLLSYHLFHFLFFFLLPFFLCLFSLPPWFTWFSPSVVYLFLSLSAVLLPLLAFTKQPASPTQPDLTYLPIVAPSLAVQWPGQSKVHIN